MKNSTFLFRVGCLFVLVLIVLILAIPQLTIAFLLLIAYLTGTPQ